MNSEDQLVERTVDAIPSVSARRYFRGVRLGIGDDAAILHADRRTESVLSCDAFVENVHFLARRHSPESVGYKSLVRAASDLVAMGATPRYFLLTLALPSSRAGAWFQGFLRGMARAARYLGMRIIGGDTTRSSSVSISITVVGEISTGRALTRAGARPGDLIYVTGKLGRAQLGLEFVLRGEFRRQRGMETVLRHHLYPTIRVQLAEWIARRQIPSAMIDISDGLSTDLGRLCSASRVGARIDARRVPRVEVPARLSRLAGRLRLDPLQMALHGGDDYELLFTVPSRRVSQLRRAPGFSEMTAIGEVTRDRRVLIVGTEGAVRPLRPSGWDSFRRT